MAAQKFLSRQASGCSMVEREPGALTLIASAEKTVLLLACMAIRVEGIDENHGGGFIPHSHFSWCCYYMQEKYGRNVSLI